MVYTNTKEEIPPDVKVGTCEILKERFMSRQAYFDQYYGLDMK
jgi:hypothetical protein